MNVLQTGIFTGMPMSSSGGMSFFPAAFGIVFVLILGVFVFVIVSGIARFAKNEASPVLTVSAKITAKRTNVSHHHHSDGVGTGSSTSYYVTFEVESGDRMELGVNGSEFGLLAEGDVGHLTFQGTRYKGFDRNR